MSDTQNAQLQRDIEAVKQEGGTAIRVNQQQVDADGIRVGINRPDLQYTDKFGIRHYVEYETPGSTRGGPHVNRLLANDPAGKAGWELVP